MSFKHGQAGYQRHGCKCEVCTEANRENARRVRAKKRHLALVNPDTIPHGTTDGYASGCKCDSCKVANRDERRMERSMYSKRGNTSGRCSVCRGLVKLKKDGTVWAHGWTGPYGAGRGHCLGSGREPLDEA